MKPYAVVLALCLTSPLRAAAGLWLPQQLPAIEDTLRQAGIAVDPKQLADPASYPWNAVVRFGDGCSGSLVSPLGLILTSRSCAPAAVTAGVGDGRDSGSGLLAATLGEERSAGIDLRAEIIERVSDVSADFLAGADGEPDAAAVQQQLIAACQSDSAYRCSIDAADAGGPYWLTRHLRIRDLRLVYLPAVDGTAATAGNFAVFRAYVGPDGQAAGYSESNVPYRPGAYLRLQGAGSGVGDFVFSAGFPATAADASLRVAYGHIQAAAVESAEPIAAPIEAAAAAVDGAAPAPVASAPSPAASRVEAVPAPRAFTIDSNAIGQGGGPLLNARAELVGVTIPAVDSATTAAAASVRMTVAAVDIRDLLRQLKAAPGAQGLLQEMGIQAVVADDQ